MAEHYITLGDGYRVSIKAYVAAVKLAIANPEAKFDRGLTCWWSVNGAEIRRQFFSMVQDHCNRGLNIGG